MTEKIALPTKECRGVDVPDMMGNPTGKVYRSRKGQEGYVEVDNPRLARMIRLSTGSMASLTIGIPESPTRRCECGELMLDWQDECAGCYMLRRDLEELVV